MGIDLLNKNNQADHVVSAPAFSITKVMATLSPLVVVLATAATSAIKQKWAAFTTAQITTMVIALLAVWTFTAAADVMARAIATAAKARADGATAAAQARSGGRPRTITFNAPFSGRLKTEGGGHKDVKVLAASDATPPELLCSMEDGTLSWNLASSVSYN